MRYSQDKAGVATTPHGGSETNLPKARKDALLKRVEGIRSEAERLHIYCTLEGLFKYDCGQLRADQLGGLQRSLIDGNLTAWNKADSINRKHFDVLVKSVHNDLSASSVMLLARCRAVLRRLVKEGKVDLSDVPTGVE
tara:strand:- start:401 stop:814 length:414 start_codon:yes stop_codon:yes gene_type:complete